ncbi:hypothetical protein [Chryseobacterium indoltheticum]|uniref:hypothetical protein n=1 Tax=Chryseobacterium indoltheticum TaxID=254 RepID=UPI001913BD7C|nr:hypothetical protein [Chryseobacterium indoltheticum]QQQ29050.1 hypothetical protein JJL46_03285 [Chryseobacterium indoltheticum]
MGSIYIGIVFVIFFLTLMLLAVLRQKKIKFYIPLIIYIFLLSSYILKVLGDIKDYQSFNKENFSNVTGISINDVMVEYDKYQSIFECLKYDEFTWVNHPTKKREYFINVFTHEKVYKFKIWNTFNEGVLIYRINDKGKEFVTNRNDRILQFIE